jgi:LPXTG-site transpeptidase (sortase) family protein
MSTFSFRGTSIKRKAFLVLRLSLVAMILLSLGYEPQFSGTAAPSLTIAPITWNVVGLDSNDPTVGPNTFPVGARVCNEGSDPATNLTATFVFDDEENLFTGDDYINLRDGSLAVLNQATLGAGTPSNPTCTDFYFEAEITRNDDAYEHTRLYHIEVTAAGGISLSTPVPRELYVEYLISQSRNSTDAVYLDGVYVPNGGTMTLTVGSEYEIMLEGSTATNGYEQIETFLHLPNTIFQVLSVSTLYAADSSDYVDNPNDKLYGDSCYWENDPDSPNYRSCLDVGKNGGDIVVTYQVKVIGGAGTTETINSLIYDFSGSSYHYNSDFSSTARIVEIVGPSSITIQKQFVPDSITPGGTSTLMITLTNPTPSTIEGVNFEDYFPAGMVVAATPNVVLTGCGSEGALLDPDELPTEDPISGGEDSISFSDGTLAPESSCTIKVNVTVPEIGTYENTTGNLFINDDVDTGNYASDTLTAAEAAACIPDRPLAHWTIPNGTTANPPDLTGGLPTTKSTRVETAAASARYPLQTAITTTVGGANDDTAWTSYGYKNDAQYLQFTVDTRHFSEVFMTFYERVDSNGPTSIVVSYATDSVFTDFATYTPTIGSFTEHTIDFTGWTNTSGNTTFRISGTGANNDQSGSNLHIDDILFEGCEETDPPPSLSKAFSDVSIPQNTTTTLTFTLSNTNAVDLTGVSFSDELPPGLQVASTPNADTDCSGPPTWAPSAGETTLTFSGASMAAGSTCMAWVDILATSAGHFDNVSGYITSDQSGENTGPDGYATDSLTAVAPPTISKWFQPSPILTDDTTTLSFTITNPNQSTALTGIGFTDDLPDGVTVGDSTSPQCGGTLTTSSTTDTIELSGASLAAGGSCTFSVEVTGATAGTKNNETSVVTSDEGGDGETATATLYVEDPIPQFNLLKQIGLTDDPDGVWTKFLSLTTFPTNVYYKFTVENTGDVDLTSVSVTDPTLTGQGLNLDACYWETLTTADPIRICIVGPLEVGSEGKLENTATAHAWYGETSVTPEPSSSAWYGSPQLTLEKSVSESYFLAVDDPLNYTYVVTNSGYTPLLGPVTISDDKVTVTCPNVNTVGDNDAYLDPADHPSGSGSLAESLTCTAQYLVTQEDVNALSVTNEASASAGGIVSNTDSTTVNYGLEGLALTLTKTGVLHNDVVGPTEVSNVGDKITYTFEVTNTGDVMLTGVVVTDTLISPLSCTIGSLDVDETKTCTADYLLTQADIDAGIVNNTATADSDQTEPINVSESVPLTQSPGLSIVKTGVLDNNVVEPDGVSNVGDEITYTFELENTGNVTLTNIVVTDPLLPSLTCMIASLDPGATQACSASYNVYSLTQEDIDAGYVDNTATADSDQTEPTSDSKTIELTQSPALSIEKKVSDDDSNWVEKVWVGVGDTVYFRIRVTNNGNVTLTELSVDDGMDDCTLGSKTVYIGDDDDDFEIDEVWEYTCSLAASAGTQINTATADTEQTEPVSDDASYVGGNIYDPPFGVKTVDDAGRPVLEWTVIWINDSNETALNVRMSDPIPVGTTYVDPSVTCTTEPGSTTTTTLCDYEGPSGAYPLGRIVWEGSLGPDFGAANADEAANEITITFSVRLDDGVKSVENVATLDANLNGDQDFDDPGESQAARAAAAWARSVPALPATGFAPGRETLLSGSQPAYTAMPEVELEVPALGIRIPIVGVPAVGGSWDVTWLTNQAGWLQGTAYPSWLGNSVLTGHAYLATGLPGPFVELKTLHWGDEIIVHAYGYRHVYKVQTREYVSPNDLSVLSHEEDAWLTLITCNGYDEVQAAYRYRVVVRAVHVYAEKE